MDIHLHDYFTILPLLILGTGILISLCIEMYVKQSEGPLAWFSVLVFFATGYSSLFLMDRTVLDSAPLATMLASGGIVNIFYFVFAFAGMLVTLFSIEYIKRMKINYGEFYILLQSAILGMMMLVAAKDLIMVFIGLEQMSICFYVLAGINRTNQKSNEASLKYLLLGSFASGFIVYGMALIYGAVHSLNVAKIAALFFAPEKNILFISGVMLFIIGFSFKVAAVPFHMWAPDVYEGAPTSVTAIMATGGKAASFFALMLINPFAAGNTAVGAVAQKAAVSFAPVFGVLATLSMLYGSITALRQESVKRMLAYSSIAHAGYMLIGLAAGNQTGYEGIVFYLAAYTFMNLGAFGILAALENAEGKFLNFDDFKGLGNRSPLAAGFLALLMFALSGLPPFAGFFGKYYIFIAAVKSGQVWLALLGVLSSVISVYFYLRLIVLMYFGKDAETDKVLTPNTAMLGVFISVCLVVLMGLFPGSLSGLVSSYFTTGLW